MAKDKKEKKQPDQNEEVVEDKVEKKAADKVKKDDVSDLKDQLEEASDKYMRAQAEIVNMRRRNEKKEAELIKYDGQKLAQAVLPALDNLERALGVEADESDQLKKGVEMVQSQLLKALSDNNITEIPADGEKFDPNLHQAVQTVPVDDDHEAETVVQVLQKGYMLKDRVLRPAMVIVAQ